MIKYGSNTAEELRFTSIEAVVERRDNQWVDIMLSFEVDAGTPIPADIIQLQGLIICTVDGMIVQMIALDEGCDSEYQFTVGEKEQMASFINQPHIQKQIRESTVPA